jgi:hypothetical protein
MLDMYMSALANACDSFKIKLPPRIIDAGKLVDATQALAAEIRAEAPPDPYTLTPANLPALHSAMVSWPSHADRLAAADRLAQVAANDHLLAAWDAFSAALLELFRQPFDAAVARLIAGDSTALEPVQHLVRVRDVLANVAPRAKVRSDAFERVTRLLVVPSYEVALNSVRFRTEGTEPYSAAWLDAVQALDCTIAWQTPADQEAADRITPALTPAPTPSAA